jgi:hypothetical protein
MQIFLFLLYLCVLGTCFLTFQGRGNFKDGAANAVKAIDSLTGTMDNLKVEANLINSSAIIMKEMGAYVAATETRSTYTAGTSSCAYKHYECTADDTTQMCDAKRAEIDPTIDDINEKIKMLGDGVNLGATLMQAPISKMDEMFSQLDEMKDTRDTIADNADKYIDMGVYAMIALYVVVVAFGVLGLVIDCKRCPIFSNLSLFFGFFVLFITAILIAVEVGLSIILADICVPSPNENLLNVNMRSRRSYAPLYSRNLFVCSRAAFGP